MTRCSELEQSIDKVVGERIGFFRRAKGLSRQQLADKIFVTHQQLSKYENAGNRVSCSRITLIAKTLEQPISSFFEESDYKSTQHQTMCIEVARNFLRIKNPEYQIAVNNLINSLANK